MKRKRELTDDCSLETPSDDFDAPHSKRKKRKHAICKMPLIDKLSLFNLHALHLITGAFCLRLRQGLAFEEMKCDICNPNESENIMNHRDENKIDQVVEQLNLKKRHDLYKVDALLRDIWQNSQCQDVFMTTNEEGNKTVVFHDVDHISWFAIQLILHNSPVHTFASEKRSVHITLQSDIEKTDKKKDAHKDDSCVLTDILIACHRNLYHLLHSKTLFETN